MKRKRKANRLMKLRIAVEYSRKGNTKYFRWKQLVGVAAGLFRQKPITNEWYLKECYECNCTPLSVYDKEEDF